MPIRYICSHCEKEIGVLPIDSPETMRKLNLYEIGEIGDYMEYDANGVTTVRCICEQCEDSLRQFPHYYSLKKWLQ